MADHCKAATDTGQSVHGEAILEKTPGTPFDTEIPTLQSLAEFEGVLARLTPGELIALLATMDSRETTLAHTQAKIGHAQS